MLTKNEEWLLERFGEYKIPAGKVIAPIDALENEQFIARDMVLEYKDANVGDMKTFGFPIKFSKSKGEIKKGSPALGENTYEILESIGYSKDEIKTLENEEIITGT